METTKPCTKCGVPTLSRGPWTAQPVPRAAKQRCRGGVCRRCANAKPGAVKTRRPSTDLLLLDWDWLHETETLTADMPLAWRCRIAAPRLGVSVSSLERALARAGITNPVQKLPDWHRQGYCKQCAKLNAELAMCEASLRVTAWTMEDVDDPSVYFSSISHSKRKRQSLRDRLAEHRATHQGQAAA